MASSAPGPDSRRILLVEDDPDVRASLKDVLEMGIPNVEVVAAASGAEALRLLRTTGPHLVVSDHRLGDMGGVDLLAKARQEAPLTPRVLMTAYADLSVALRAINEARIARFVQKPFDVPQLLREVGEVLERETARRQEVLLLARTMGQASSQRRR